MDKLQDVVGRAELFATGAHAGELRKDGVTPYIVHPAEIVTTLRKVGVASSVLAAAWLHDVVEDTETTLEEIYTEFGDEIGGLVDVLSHRKPSESREHYHSRVLSGSPEGKLIKVADLEHNIRTIEYLNDEAQERKLREAEDLYLPLREELCAPYGCDALFDALEGHVAGFKRDSGDTPEGPQDSREKKKIYAVVQKGWIESEHGWGQKPYGYTLHETLEDLKEYVDEHWATWPDEIPEWYYGPSLSKANLVDVDEETYREIKQSKNGIRRWK